MSLTHILSPIYYAFFVKLISYIPPCAESYIMKFFRKVHNIFLSILSFLMLVGILFSTYQANKFESVNSLLCSPYNDNLITNISVYSFLYSKYLEWGDTLFLQLSGKQISMLQYTHHMSTAFLVYLNLHEMISPFFLIFQGLNCLVHIPMYWYFAYPKGFLYKYRKLITQSQIVQHIICVSVSLYTLTLDNCKQSKYGNECGSLLYIMYLFYFTAFYLKSYLNKKIK